MHTLKCPSCAGQIVADEDKDVHFCPYCGTAISDDVKKYSLKIDIKTENNKTITHRDTAKEKKFAADISGNKLLALVAILLALLFVYLFIDNASSSRSAEDKANQALIAVQQELDAGNYETALIKADLIRWTGDDREAERIKKWDKEREVMIKLIKEAQKEAGK